MYKTFNSFWPTLAVIVFASFSTFASTDNLPVVHKPAIKQVIDTHQSTVPIAPIEHSPPHSVASTLAQLGAVMPSNPTFTERGYIDKGDDISVSAWSGLPSITIPLVHVQGNDGLSLNLTYAYNLSDTKGFTGHFPPSYIVAHTFGLHGSLMPGLTDSKDPFEGRSFRDEYGKTHTLYPTNFKTINGITCEYSVSRDHWRGKSCNKPSNLNQHFPHEIISPNGTTYILNNNEDASPSRLLLDLSNKRHTSAS